MTRALSHERFPLTSLQQGMLAHQLRAPGSGIDIEQIACTLAEAVDGDVLRRCWDDVVQAHPELRVAFEWTDRPEQVVHQGARVPFEELDWRGLDAARRDVAWREWLRADRTRGVDLSVAPLMRLTLLRIGEREFRLVWTFHHALLDGRCFPIMLGEVFDAYDARMRSAVVPPPPVRPPFAEFVAWLASRDAAASDVFWRGALECVTGPTQIPFVRSVSADERPGQADREVSLPPALVERLREVARTNGVTLNTVLQGAWALLLSRYSGENSVVFGVVRAGRRDTVPNADEMLGLCVTTVPLRVIVNHGQPMGAWLRDVRGAWDALRPHEHTPLTRIHACTNVPPGQPMFDSVLMFEQYELDALLRARGDAWTSRRFRLYEQNGFPLTLAVYASDALLIRAEFDPSRIAADAIERSLRHLETLLGAIAGQPDALVGTLPTMPASELAWIAAASSGERVDYRGPETLAELLDQQMRLTPGASAVRDEERVITYAELDRASAALAHRLRGEGVAGGSLVGVCAERSVALVVGLVAVIRAGGAYVPIDPEYPEDRVAFMLADANVSVLLASERISRQLPTDGARVLLLDDVLDHASTESLPMPRADDRAYMIYTSGSTGRPKGAINAHRGIVNRLQWMQAEYQLVRADVVLQKTPFSFDVSVWEFFWPLMTGAELVMARPGGHRDTSYLVEAIRRNGITVCHFVPSMLRAFLADPQAATCTGLRDVMASGEALSPDLVTQFYAVLPDAFLHNLYGPTECAVDVSYWSCPSGTELQRVPIGRPVANTQLHVLDAAGRPTPIGIPGELFIGGVQVGMGYHNRPDLTTERFVPDPFATGADAAIARLYRTGDLARWQTDGTIEYLGRLDFQVKVRGFRIELGEIEATLLALPSVRDAVVTAYSADAAQEKRLVAYVVPTADTPAVSELRAAMSETLPDYMVPGVFVFLDALPLSSNGKVDRTALPAPDVARAARTRARVAPRNDAEAILAGIWARVLRAEQVSVEDNFFELGGDSLLAIQIVSQAARAGLRLSLTRALQNPTIAAQAEVAEVLHARTGADDSSSAQGAVPLTPVQRWLAERNVPALDHWNQAFVFATPSLDVSRMERAFGQVVAHHDAFRLRFRYDARGELLQWYTDTAPPAMLGVIDLSGVADADLGAAINVRAAGIHASLHLGEGPVISAAYFDLGHARGGRLLIAAHHLVIDAVSWRIFLEDIEALYHNPQAAPEMVLPPRTSSFGSWSAALAALARTDSLAGEVPYWREQIAAPTTALPVDRAGENVEGVVEIAEVTLSEAETAELISRVPAVYRTQINDVLLAALESALGDWLGSGELLVDLEGHGREEIDAGVDVSRTVGWFTSIYPVRLSLERRAPHEHLPGMKERLRAMPRRGLGFGVLRYLGSDIAVRSGARAEVLFNYFGQLDRMVEGSRLFQLASESAGAWRSTRATRAHLLEINAQVRHGRLVTHFGFASTIHERATIERVAASFAGALREILAHSRMPGARAYSPSDFPAAGLDQPALNRLLGTGDIEDIYPATPLQSLFLGTVGGADDPGLQQYVFGLEGDLDVEALHEAWNAVVRRHDVLRARFAIEGARAFVIVERDAVLPWTVEDWRGSADIDGRIAELLRAEAVRGIDAATAPLMRMNLVRTADTQWVMAWTNHHLLLDRWSWPLVLREVGARYAGARRHQSVSFPAAVPFRSYVEWTSVQNRDAAERYWREEFAGLDEPLQLLPANRVRATAEPSWQRRTTQLSADETRALRDAVRALGLRLNIAVQGAWALALGHMGQRDDVTFGLAVSGRGAELPNVDRLVGVLINNVPVRTCVGEARPVGEWLARMQARQAVLPQVEHVSLEEIQRWSGVPWRYRLFESLLVFQDASADADAHDWFDATLVVNSLDTPTKTTYPLTVLITGVERLDIELLFDERVVPPLLADQLIAAVRSALRAMRTDLSVDVDVLRSSLPERREFQVSSASEAVAAERVEPRTPVEAVLARIWGEFLGVTAVGVTDNFLALGGHSLLATQIVSRVRDTFHVDVPVRALFTAGTVAELARTLRSLERKPGQVARIAQLVQQVHGMTADELLRARAEREHHTTNTALVHDD